MAGKKKTDRKVPNPKELNVLEGPICNPAYEMGQVGVPGSDVTSSMFEDSFVMQFSFHHH